MTPCDVAPVTCRGLPASSTYDSDALRLLQTLQDPRRGLFTPRGIIRDQVQVRPLFDTTRARFYLETCKLPRLTDGY